MSLEDGGIISPAEKAELNRAGREFYAFVDEGVREARYGISSINTRAQALPGSSLYESHKRRNDTDRRPLEARVKAGENLMKTVRENRVFSDSERAVARGFIRRVAEKADEVEKSAEVSFVAPWAHQLKEKGGSAYIDMVAKGQRLNSEYQAIAGVGHFIGHPENVRPDEGRDTLKKFLNEKRIPYDEAAKMDGLLRYDEDTKKVVELRGLAAKQAANFELIDRARGVLFGRANKETKYPAQKVG